MSIDIAPELEQRLKSAAAKQGQELAEFVTPALEALVNTQEVPEDTAETSEGHSLLSFFEALWRRIPPEEMAKLPTDFAEEHDHYIYGTPKRNQSR